MFVKTLKGKFYKKKQPVIASRGYLNKFLDQYNNTYHHCIDKRHLDIDYSALIEQIE